MPYGYLPLPPNGGLNRGGWMRYFDEQQLQNGVDPFRPADAPEVSINARPLPRLKNSENNVAPPPKTQGASPKRELPATQTSIDALNQQIASYDNLLNPQQKPTVNPLGRALHYVGLDTPGWQSYDYRSGASKSGSPLNLQLQANRGDLIQQRDLLMQRIAQEQEAQSSAARQATALYNAGQAMLPGARWAPGYDETSPYNASLAPGATQGTGRPVDPYNLIAQGTLAGYVAPQQGSSISETLKRGGEEGRANAMLPFQQREQSARAAREEFGLTTDQAKELRAQSKEQRDIESHKVNLFKTQVDIAKMQQEMSLGRFKSDQEIEDGASKSPVPELARAYWYGVRAGKVPDNVATIYHKVNDVFSSSNTAEGKLKELSAMAKPMKDAGMLKGDAKAQWIAAGVSLLGQLGTDRSKLQQFALAADRNNGDYDAAYKDVFGTKIPDTPQPGGAAAVPVQGTGNVSGPPDSYPGLFGMGTFSPGTLGYRLRDIGRIDPNAPQANLPPIPMK